MKKKTDARLWKMILLFTMLLWSSQYIVSVSLLENYAPMSMVVFRFAPAGLALLIFSLFSKKPFTKLKLSRKELGWFLLANITGTMPSLFLMIGVKYAGASLASIIINTTAFFIAIIAAIIGTEKLTSRKIGGISLGILGLMLVIFRDQNLGDVLASAEMKGMLACLVSAIGIAIYTVIIKNKLIPKFGSLNTTLIGLLPATFLILILGLVFDPAAIAIQSTSDFFKILYLGVVTTALVWVIFAESLHHLEASEASTFKLLIPPCAAFLAFLFFGESLVWQFYLGMGIVLSGIYVVTHKKA
jgi:drug/metabolite transporter (DMT)-like permease